MSIINKLTTFSFSNLSKYRNIIMGMQIISIILFHYTENCADANVGFTGIVYSYYQFIHSSGVDIFLFVSGLGLYYSWKKTSILKYFYKKRLNRILVPYFIVAIPGWFWIDFIYHHENMITYLKDLFFVSFFTEGERLFWYILMSLICYLIFPFIFNIIDKYESQIISWLRVIALCVIATIITNTIRISNETIYSDLSIALTRFPSFITGIMAGKLSYEDKKISIAWILGLLGFAVWLVGPRDIIGEEITGIYSITLLNICICFLIIHIMDFIEDIELSWINYFKKILTWFGQYSLEIYLVHMLVRRVMHYSGFVLYEISNEIIMVIVSLILSYFLKIITTSIYQKQKLFNH